MGLIDLIRAIFGNNVPNEKKNIDRTAMEKDMDAVNDIYSDDIDDDDDDDGSFFDDDDEVYDGDDDNEVDDDDDF